MLNDFSQILPERLRPLRRAEYDHLVERGTFEGEKIELLSGVLVEMSPQGAAHAHVISVLNALLLTKLVGRAIVRVQSPIGASDESEPEPDFAVIPLGDYSHAHPQRAHLVIEVSVSSSLRKDAGIKAKIYATAAIPAYWIVDIPTRRVLVHEDPQNGVYQKLTTFGENDVLTLAEFPDITVPIAHILPSVKGEPEPKLP